MNLALLLEMAAEAMPDRIAVGTLARGMSYRQLLHRSRRTATFLADRDAERVGLIATSSDLVPTLIYATAMLGIPFSPLNYRLADDRLHSVVERLAPAVLVVNELAQRRMAPPGDVDLIAAEELLSLVASSVDHERPGADPDGQAIWLFTSGTTGDPKIAVLRHRHLVSYVLGTVEFMSAEPDDAALVCVPPYHIAGVASVLSNTYAGRRVVYLPDFDPRAWVSLARDEAVTHAMVVPTMLGRILDEVERSGTLLPSLRHLSYGGGRMPMAVVERALDLFPDVDFVNAYGLTETSSTVAVLGPDDHRRARRSDEPSIRARLGSVGRPLPSLELEVRGPDGRPLRSGEVGEIFVRGDQVAGEYHDGHRIDPGGWFPTNDSGRLDHDGFLFLDGRLDDVIIRGAENISPTEIEDVLRTHDEVDDVAVTGVPDDEWGEAVAAAVVLTPRATVTEADLKVWVRDRLRSSRTPDAIQIWSTLPYTETGKLLRRIVRAELIGAPQDG